MFRYWVLLGLMAGCSSVRVVRPDPLFVGERLVESRPLPILPGDIDLSRYPGDERQVMPVEAGTQASFPGILVTERRAARDLTFRISYKELRLLYEADRLEWKTQRELYEEQLVAASEKIQQLQPSWFQQHRMELGILGGFILGTTATIAILRH